MAKNLTRKRSILVGEEVRYGTAPTLTLADAVQMADYSPTPLEAATVERTLFRPFVGAAAELTASRTAIANPTCELVGGGLKSGDDGNPTDEPLKPQFYKLLLACGMVEQGIDAAGEAATGDAVRGWKYTVGDPTTAKSVTIQSRVDTITQSITGCRGTFVITAELGAIPTIAFTMTGRYNKPGLVTAERTGTRPTDVPPSLVGSENSRVNGAWPALMPRGDESAPCASSISVDCGHTVTVRDCISDNTGMGVSTPGVIITDRTTTGAITVDADLALAGQPTTAGDNPWDTAGTGVAVDGLTPQVVSGNVSGLLRHGTKPGEWWSLGGPSVTVGAITEEDRDGILAYSLPLRFVPTGNGNNEFSIVFWGKVA